MKQVSDVSMFEVALLHTRANRALRVMVNERLEQFGISMMEWLLLSIVSSGKNNGLSMTAIANALDVTLPQVTALNNTMLKQRYVRQKTQSSDRRSRHVIITAKGKALLEKAEAVITGALKNWLSAIPEDKFADYLQTVETIAQLPPEE